MGYSDTELCLDVMKKHVYAQQTLSHWLKMEIARGAIGTGGGVVVGAASAPLLAGTLPFLGLTNTTIWTLFGGSQVGISIAAGGTALVAGGAAVLVAGIAIAGASAAYLLNLPKDKADLIYSSNEQCHAAAKTLTENSTFDDEIKYYNGLECSMPAAGASTRATLLKLCKGPIADVSGGLQRATDLTKLWSVWERVVHMVNPTAQCDTFKYLRTSAGAGLLASGQEANGYRHGRAFCPSRVSVTECVYIDEAGKERLKVTRALTVSPSQEEAQQPFIVILDLRKVPADNVQPKDQNNVTITWLQAIAIVASLAHWNHNQAKKAREQLLEIPSRHPPQLGFVNWV